MSLNFPNSPANGENFVAPNGVTYRWDGEKWVGSIPPSSSPWLESNGVVSLNNSGSTVGVGTSSTSGRKLEVAGHIGVVGGGNLLLQNGARVQYGGSDAASVIGQDGSNGYLLFGVGNERARITPTGFGIGTSTPLAKLTVSSGSTGITPVVDADELLLESDGNTGMTIATGPDSTGNIYFAESLTGVSRGAIVYDTSSDSMAFSTAGLVNERMRLTSNSRLGIGTSSPKRRLHVNNTAGDVFTTITGDTNSYAGVLLGNQADDARGQVIYNNLDNSLYFVTNNSGEKMRITSGGFMGIGVSNPANKLEVASTAQHRIAVKSTDTTMSVGSDYGGFRFASSHASNPRAVNWDIRQVAGNTAGNTNLTIDSHAVNDVVKILSGGNVGLNTSNPTRPLVVNRSTSNSWISVRSSDTNRAGILMGDQTADATGQIAYNNSTEAMEFVAAGSEKMRLTSTGLLGLGNSNPDSRLHIGGSMNANNYITFHNRVPAAQTNKPLIGQTSGANGNDGSAQDLGLCATSSSGAIRFFTGNNAAGFGTGANTERMSISSSGVVAITGSLTVNGQSVATGNIAEAPTDGQQYARQNSAWSVVSSSSSSGGYVNVKDLGAVGNGTTDDTTAIRTALQGGGGVYFPAGTYRVTSTITVTNKGLHMYGDGGASQILFDSSITNDNFLVLQYDNGGYDNGKVYAISNLVIHAKQNKVFGKGVTLQYNGASTLVGPFNKLVLTNVDIGSEHTIDANTGYFKTGLQLLNSAGVVGTNVNIYTNAKTKVEYGVTDSIAIHIQNTLGNHMMIRTLMLNNIYLQRYHTAIKSEITAGDQGNIETIYLNQGEILAAKAMDIDVGSAITVIGCHSDVRDYFFDGTRNANTIRIVGSDIRANRVDSEDTTTRDFLMKFRGQNITITGNNIMSFKNTAGILYSGGSNSNHANMVITGNHFAGNGSSSFRVLRTDVGSTNVTFGGNTLEQFGGNNNPIFNSVGSQLYVYGQRP
mgnify:CR=1 FL=1